MADETKSDSLASAAEDMDRAARIESGMPSQREIDNVTSELPAGSTVKFVGWVTQTKKDKEAGERLLALTDTCFFTFKKKSKVVGGSTVSLSKKINLLYLKSIAFVAGDAAAPSMLECGEQGTFQFASARNAELFGAVNVAAKMCTMQLPAAAQHSVSGSLAGAPPALLLLLMLMVVIVDPYYSTHPNPRI